MSILNATQMNIVEAQKRDNYTDSATFLANLVKLNDFLNVAPWIPSNHGIMHQYLRATKLGSGGWGKVNSGIPGSGSKSDLVKENLKLYECESKVDERLLDGADSPQKVRDSEDVAQLEGFMQDYLSKVLYNTDKDDGFTGLFQRRAKIATNLTWDGGGDTALKETSMLLVEFGDRGFQFVYKSGQPAGISNEDRGRARVSADDGSGEYWAWIRYYKVLGSMIINNEKGVQRLANLDTSDDSLAFPATTFVKMKNQLPSAGKSAAGFVNRTVKALIENYCLDKSNAYFTIGEIEDYGPVNKIVGIPIWMLEAITETEAVVS